MWQDGLLVGNIGRRLYTPARIETGLTTPRRIYERDELASGWQSHALNTSLY